MAAKFTAKKKVAMVVGFALMVTVASSGLALIMAVVGSGLSVLTVGSLRAALPFGIATGVLALVGGVAAIYPRIDAAIQRGFSTFVRLWFWLAALIFPLWVTLYFARSILIGVPLWLQVVFLIVWGFLLAGAIGSIIVPVWRASLFSFLSPFGVLAPIWYAINVFVIATVFFAAVSTLLAHGQLVTLVPRPERAGLMTDSTILHGMLLDFFMWHFFAELPLHVNETLQWDSPLRYQGPGMGGILLLYKVTVIAPVIAVFVLWWKQRTGREPGEGGQQES
jgi:hypothetical protein